MIEKRVFLDAVIETITYILFSGNEAGVYNVF
jgi:hypothetical protein